MSETTAIATIQTPPPSETLTGKSALLPYLPENIKSKLSKPYLATIASPKLKFSDDIQHGVFAEKVLLYIDPKFDNENEFEVAKSKLIEFAKTSELTSDEFLHALELCAEGKLITEDEKGEFKKVKIFREINALKLHEIKSAYILYRNTSKEFETSENIVKAFLEPPKPEMSDEEKLQWAIKTFKVEYARLLAGELYNCFIFFDIITINEGVKTIKLSWLKKIFADWDVSRNKINDNNFKKVLSEITNPFNYLKQRFVLTYIENHRLLDLSVEKWVEYWTEEYKKATEK